MRTVVIIAVNLSWIVALILAEWWVTRPISGPAHTDTPDTPE